MEQIETEMDSTLTIKKLERLKQRPQAPIGQAGKVHVHHGERPGGTFKLPSAKFDMIPSTSRAGSPTRMNGQCNAQGLTRSLQRSYSVKSMDSDTDRIVANLNLEEINNYNT